MRIAVIGTGYVGLVTGTCFADSGNDVACVDVDEAKVERLRAGKSTIHEPGLEELLAYNLAAGRLTFTTELRPACAPAEVVFLCVGTPSLPDGAPDMSQVFRAVDDVIAATGEGDRKALVLKSTVPVGTAAAVRARVVDARRRLDVVSNPEFLKEGAAIDDFLRPDRVVVGTEDGRGDTPVAMTLRELYEPFVRTGKPILFMDNASAELTKYGANALLASRISFMNELANLAERVGADVNLVRHGMATDSRIGYSFLFPGAGFGGSCLAGRETVLVREAAGPHGSPPWRTRLVRLDELFARVGPPSLARSASSAGARPGDSGSAGPRRRRGDPTPHVARPRGLSVLSWDPARGAEWREVSAVTRRPFEGQALEVRTKMGRRVRCTPDHPFVVRDGQGGPVRVKLASELGTDDWLPVAQDREDARADDPRLDLLAALPSLGFEEREVIVRLGAPVEQSAAAVRAAIAPLGHPDPAGRAHDIVRSGTLRLHEARALGVSLAGAALGTAKNGTYVPVALVADEAFWRVVGLYVAEGHVSVDGRRHRLSWSFHPTAEDALVQEVAGFWARHGVTAHVYRRPTTTQVLVSSRILARWWTAWLGLGADCYAQRLPDLAWSLRADLRRALLSGTWQGDGSWTRVNGGPSVVLEYGTVSRALADGLLRLLGDMGFVARLRVGRTAKSTVDTYWLIVSGAEQVERLLDLVKAEDRDDVRGSIARQAKRIAPTGYRRFGDPTAWARVDLVRRRPWRGFVYSLEVPGNETFVATGGLVVHNCFPKDVDALGHTGTRHGLELLVLKATNEVNRRQKRVLFEKVSARFGGDLAGKRIAVWGLAFKPNTDDMREAPSLTVIGALLDAGASVCAYDPAAVRTTRDVLGDRIEYAKKAYDALAAADALVICTEWNEFRRPDWQRVKAAMRQPIIFDGRNIFEPARCEAAGFEYYGIGRGRRLGNGGGR